VDGEISIDSYDVERRRSGNSGEQEDGSIVVNLGKRRVDD
jgi:hypothetical protein